MGDSERDLDPAIARRILSERLRQLRVAAGLSREEVGERLEWSQSKLVRIESGSQGVSASDLAAMTQLYGVAGNPETAELSGLARASRRPPWWTRYRDQVSKQLGQLLSLEPLASSIRVFHPLLVPGLLHTEDYARELLLLARDRERADPLVRLRVERQRRFFAQDPPPGKTFVFGEEALRHRVGTEGTMREQYRHLLEVSEHGSAEIRVVPADADAHPGLGGPFTLLDLDATGESLLFVEASIGDFAVKDAEAIAAFGETFSRVLETALAPSATRDLLGRYLAR